MNLLKKIFGFINLDVQNEYENKHFAVALRCLSLSNVVLYIVYSYYFFANRSNFLSCTTFILAVANGITVYLTYKNATKQAFILKTTVNLGGILVLTHQLGWKAGFQYYFIGTVIMVYFLHLKKNSIKFVYTFFVGILFWVLHESFANVEMSVGALTGIIGFCGSVNAVNLFLQLSIICYFLNYHSNQVEVKLIKYNEKLKILASMDPLTNLLNRRSMMEYLQKRLLNYCINNIGFVLSIGDIDFFKKINDTYGHECGDAVLKELALMTDEFMKGRGKVSRWGGEEFLICIDNVNVDEANVLIWDLLKLIRNREIVYKGQVIKITMTFGVVEFDPYGGLEETIKKADDLLYQGKDAGRNRVMY